MQFSCTFNFRKVVWQRIGRNVIGFILASSAVNSSVNSTVKELLKCSICQNYRTNKSDSIFYRQTNQMFGASDSALMLTLRALQMLVLLLLLLFFIVGIYSRERFKI